MSNIYLQRYATAKHYLSTERYGTPNIVVTLPCYNEPDLMGSLEALERCSAPKGEVSIIVIVNASVTETDEVKRHNEQTYRQGLEWASSTERQFSYHFILENEMPKKHAGVGLARKIAMDEAVRIFESQGKDGLIVCFDADSDCSTNLFVALEKAFENESVPGCSIRFEHPLEGQLHEAIYSGIINYELHLRYYVDGLKYANYPFAFHTVGSSMAVRSSAYQKQGGMNRRKAGEDFYFLNKIIPMKGFLNVNDACIIPSPRVSDRVPFGTGKAIGAWLKTDQIEMETYHFKIFQDLKTFILAIDSFFEIENQEENWTLLPKSVKAFVPYLMFEEKLKEINYHSNHLTTFRKRFFQWFDAFKVLKFIHFARDEFHDNISVDKATNWLLSLERERQEKLSLKDKLERIRVLDKSEAKFSGNEPQHGV